MKITALHARQILDSRGKPTVETEVSIEGGFVGRAAVPSGASTGTYEALELRDGDKSKYLGHGVLKAVENVKTTILDAVKGKDFDQASLDKFLIELDGTDSKSKLGANAILSVSLGFAWAVAQAQHRPLYQYIGELYGNTKFVMPRPMFNIMNGGKHAEWATDIQEYMVLPAGDIPYAEKLRIGVEIYLTLQKLLEGKGYSVNVGNEGGFAPKVGSNQEALDLIVAATEKAGYKPGVDVHFGFDAAASEFFNKDTKQYDLKKDGRSLTTEEMVQWSLELGEKYPVISFEDMLSEDDWAGWTSFTSQVKPGVQVVGDDILVTNVKRIERAIKEKSCSALLVKVNQIGSLTETLQAMKMAQDAGWNNVVSHRSAETEDVTISHLVVGTGAGQIKTGAPSRGERTAKYNELLRIAEEVER